MHQGTVMIMLVRFKLVARHVNLEGNNKGRAGQDRIGQDRIGQDRTGC
jgi:hypothetical protein